MDFTTNRNNAQPPARGDGGGHKSKDATWKASPGWLKMFWMVLLFSGALLLASVVTLLLLGGKAQESDLVEDDKYQAVFMDNNQVYFGKINTINDKFLDLQGIYYLRVDQPVQPERDGQSAQNNVTLQKLGCELHGPVDQMIVNREHVTFWENLKSDGQVSQAIGEWLKQNPEGMQCDGGQAAADDTEATSEETDEEQ